MKIAKVIANPYCALDAQGIPQGVVPLPGAAGIWIGARLDLVASNRTGKNRFYFPPAKDGGPRIVDVPVEDASARACIARAIKDGALLAADPLTAQLVGIPERKYKAIPAALEQQRLRALDTFQALRGKDAELGEVPEEATASDEELAREAEEKERVGASLVVKKHDRDAEAAAGKGQ